MSSIPGKEALRNLLPQYSQQHPYKFLITMSVDKRGPKDYLFLLKYIYFKHVHILTELKRFL